jgi:ATP-dependent RNA helicase MSS116
MDYQDVTAVIQVGVAASVEQYVHRLGRTARAGKSGVGVIVLVDWESFFLREITKKFPVNPHPGASPAVPGGPNPLAAVSEPEAARISRAIAGLSRETKLQTYQAFLGFYKGLLRNISMNPAALVATANKWAACMKLADPHIFAKAAGKMGLRGVPGLNIVRD